MEFFGYMQNAFGQVSILAVLVILGYICDKAGLYTQDTSRRCNDLLFYIITPAVIINSFLNVEFNWESGLSFLSALLVFAVFHGVVALLVLLVEWLILDRRNPLLARFNIFGQKQE